MSDIGLTVLGMAGPSPRYDVTITVERGAGHLQPSRVRRRSRGITVPLIVPQLMSVLPFALLELWQLARVIDTLHQVFHSLESV